MNAWTLVLRGLRHYRRTNAGVLFGTAIASATLIGALVVGDSVRASLRRRAEARIGSVDAVLSSGDRFFRTSLADALTSAPGDEVLAPVVQVRGVASSGDGGRRVHDVAVYGVDARFFRMSPGGEALEPPDARAAFVSESLAERLELSTGDEIVLRVERPSDLPRDVVLALDDISLALRVEIADVLPSERFGHFGLRAEPVPPANLVLSLEWLQEELEVEGRCNLLLADLELPAAEIVPELSARLRSSWTPADAELELRTLEDAAHPGQELLELRTSRIFLEDPIVRALEAMPAELARTGVLTYFVNALTAGDRATPYSMVTALGPLGPYVPNGQGAAPSWSAIMPAGATEDAIVLNAWAADDLEAQPGDEVTLSYQVVDASRRLTEATRTFRLHSVVPLEGLAADRELMPEFPGLADAENCRDWETGVPVDLDAIRTEDETYWDDFGGTPKAFVSLAAGRAMWSSRFGSLTSVRFAPEAETEVRRVLKEDLDPASLGLFFTDVRGSALASGNSPTDFGGLFIGLSFFLIVAALLLATQLFLFGVDQRSAEIGLYAALGFRPQAIGRLFFGEAFLLALLGILLGVPLGLAYTRVVLWGLATIWRGAVASTALGFHASPATVMAGVALALSATMLTVGFALRRRMMIFSFRLLVGAGEAESRASASAARRRLYLAGAVLGGVGALLFVVLVDARSGTAAAGAFFGAGALVLASGLCACRFVLQPRPSFEGDSRSPVRSPIRSIGELGLRNASRRLSRSLATVALMAIGTFLVVAVGANRQGPTQDSGERASGTGGFALYGRSSLAVVHDLNTPRGREAFGLDDNELDDVAVVSFRVRGGDDASCLNLAAPQTPRLLGVEARELAGREAFRFAEPASDPESPWRLLEEPLPDGAVPAIGDTTSLTWQLKKKVGDTLEFTDERGRPFDVRIVGAIADTVLQGDLVIAGSRFQELYPTEEGYRAFLVDVPFERADEVSARVSRALEDVGLSLERTGARLDSFHAVQNTYLAIFQVLGALGLLLGSVGLGMVVLRNTLERRGELALANALGFTRADVRWWLLSEYGFLLSLGLAVGCASALVAILPAVLSPGSEFPLTNILLLTAVVAGNGLFWIVVASRSAVQRTPLAALGEE